jgi:hypothetical protein
MSPVLQTLCAVRLGTDPRTCAAYLECGWTARPDAHRGCPCPLPRPSRSLEPEAIPNEREQS